MTGGDSSEYVRLPPLHLRRASQRPSRGGKARLRERPDLYQEPAAVALLTTRIGVDCELAVTLRSAEIQADGQPRQLFDQPGLARPGAAAKEHRTVRRGAF